MTHPTRQLAIDISKTDRRNAYSASMQTATQAARPLENEEGSGVEAPNPVLLGKPNSMRQLELDDFRFAGEYPWRDEGRLRALFVGEGLSAYQMAERWGCSHATVSKWIGEYGIRRAPPWKDEEVLRRLYVEQGRSQKEVGAILDCSQRTVGDWLRRCDIEIRSKGGRYTPEELSNESLLRDLYTDQGLSVRDIGERIGESGELVWWWLHRHGIETRGPAGTRAIQELRDPEFVHELYVEEDLTSNQISERYGWSGSAILRWAKRHGIETRGRGARLGELNAAWKGGHVTHRRGAWEARREAAKDRDGHVCRWCKIPDDAHKERAGFGLDVHHIVPYSTFDDPFEANQLDNLLTVCRRCHRALEGKSGVD